MKLQINYVCDVCEKSFSLDFKNPSQNFQIICPNCKVVYKFSPGELKKFKECYLDLLTRLERSDKENPK